MITSILGKHNSSFKNICTLLQQIILKFEELIDQLIIQHQPTYFFLKLT